MGTYATAALATVGKGFILRPESRVRYGGTLETTSWVAATYSAPLGVTGGRDLGILASLNFTHRPTYSPVPQINFREGVLYEVTGEETTVVLGLKEFRPEVLAEAFGGGSFINFSNPLEGLIRWGGGSAFAETPLVIDMTNAWSQLPTSGGIETRLNGMILTLYKTILEGGLPLAAIMAGETNVAELTFRVMNDTSRARGNRLGNLYIY